MRWPDRLAGVIGALLLLAVLVPMGLMLWSLLEQGGAVLSVDFLLDDPRQESFSRQHLLFLCGIEKVDFDRFGAGNVGAEVRQTQAALLRDNFLFGLCLDPRVNHRQRSNSPSILVLANIDDKHLQITPDLICRQPDPVGLHHRLVHRQGKLHDGIIDLRNRRKLLPENRMIVRIDRKDTGHHVPRGVSDSTSRSNIFEFSDSVTEPKGTIICSTLSIETKTSPIDRLRASTPIAQTDTRANEQLPGRLAESTTSPATFGQMAESTTITLTNIRPLWPNQ